MFFYENNYKVAETKEYQSIVDIALIPLKKEELCKYCNSLEIKKKGKKKQSYFDVPDKNKRIRLIVEIQSYFCKKCKRTFQDSLPLMTEKRRLTERALIYILKQSLSRPLTHIAKEVGMSEGNIRKILKEERES